jgi:putative (di)nucleoside polyphosphate hydrolase
MIVNLSQKTELLPYRRGVGIVLFNKDGLVFAGRRKGIHSEAWQMPQGGIDEGESPEQAVMRELEEETGTNKAKIVAKTLDWLSYDLPENLINVTWNGQFRGQIQKWFAIRFLGSDKDINISAFEKPEFIEWQWLEISDLLRYIVPFKHQLYKDIISEFKDLQIQVKFTK